MLLANCHLNYWDYFLLFVTFSLWILLFFHCSFDYICTKTQYIFILNKVYFNKKKSQYLSPTKIVSDFFSLLKIFFVSWNLSKNWILGDISANIWIQKYEIILVFLEPCYIFNNPMFIFQYFANFN